MKDIKQKLLELESNLVSNCDNEEVFEYFHKLKDAILDSGSKGKQRYFIIYYTAQASENTISTGSFGAIGSTFPSREDKETYLKNKNGFDWAIVTNIQELPKEDFNSFFEIEEYNHEQ